VLGAWALEERDKGRQFKLEQELKFMLNQGRR
jgi:hypothetical protein